MKKKLLFVFFLLLMGVFINVKAFNNTLLNVDFPRSSSNVNNELLVQGWVMSETDNNISISIDGKQITSLINRNEREDVLAAVTGYGGDRNKTPGFQTFIDISKYDYGKHSLKIEALDSNNRLLASEQREFTIKAPETLLNVDFPRNRSNVNNELLVQGWVMSETDNNISISIDGKQITSLINRNEREDVLAAVTGYGGDRNKTPGFQSFIDISNYDYGKHSLKIEALDSNNKLLASEQREFIIKAPATLLNVDFPKYDSTNKDSIFVQGWVMSELDDFDVQVFLDNKKLDIPVSRYLRSDVISAVKNYGENNTNPGFTTLVNTENVEDGKHTLSIKVVNKDKIVEEKNINIKIKKYISFLNVDFPVQDRNEYSSLFVQGWVMSDDQKGKLKFFIDGAEVTADVLRYARDDVVNSINGYGGTINTNPGFTTVIDLSSYSYGIHVLKTLYYNRNDEVIATSSKEFKIIKPKTIVNLDFPSNNQTVSSAVYLNGWMMSEDKRTNLEILVDGEKVDSSIERVARDDVLKAIKGYGDKEENELPGFLTKLDLSNLYDGKHTITIRALDCHGTVVNETKREILLKKYETNLDILTPNDGDTSKLSMTITGKVNTTALNSEMEFYIDNNKVSPTLSMIDNSFKANIDTSNLADGTHLLKIKLRTSHLNEIIFEATRKFNIKKYDGIITLDFPSSGSLNKDNDVFVRGWVMSEDINSKVKVFYDDNEITDVIRTNREDVLDIITAYGGRETNKTPGFQTTIDSKLLTTGYHTITINLYNSVDEIIKTYNKKVYIYDKMKLGIDVSQYNGNIDWTSVKYSGMVDFAFVRLGFRGYAPTGKMVTDTKFVSNATSSINNGINTGVYFFSQATSYEEGQAEANYVREILALNPVVSSNLKLPIALDVEYSTEPSHNGRADNISTSSRTAAIRGFVETIEKYGFSSVIYINKDFLYNKVDMKQIGNCDIWLAHWTYDYNDKSDYAGAYKYWQYSNKGSVSGIIGSVDLDILYE